MHFGVLCFFPRHASNVVPLLKALPRVCDEVTLYTVPRIVEEWGDAMPGLFEGIRLVVAEDDELPAVRAMLPAMMQDTRDKLDVLHFDELPDFWHAQSMQPGCPCIYTIHNINQMFEFWPRVKRFEFKRLVYNRRILGRFAALNAVGSNQAQYLRELQKRPVFRFPPRVYEPGRVEKLRAESPAATDRMTFSVVGSVDQVRRNYMLALDAFERIFRDYPNRAQLVLLGTQAYDRDAPIFERADQLNAAGGEVITFSRNIPQPFFERWLAGTDFLIAPNMAKSITEKYGISKVAGDLGDRLQWGLPILVSQSYAQDAEFERSTLDFGDANALYEHLARLLNNPGEVGAFKTAAHEVSMKYSIEEVTEYFRRDVIPVVQRLKKNR